MELLKYTIGIMIFIYILILFCAIPITLSGFNLYNLFAKRKRLKNLTCYTTMILGPIFMAILCDVWGVADWQIPVVIGSGIELHTPIASFFMPTILFFAVTAIAGYLLLYIKKTRMQPLLLVFCISAVYIGCGLGMAYIIQIAPNINRIYIDFPVANIPIINYFIVFMKSSMGYFMCLFPLNFIVLTVTLILEVMKEMKSHPIEEKSKFTTWLYRIIIKGSSLPLAALIAVIPLFGVCIAILVLFGQQPDAMVKAFTETSDWLFSTKVSPPPINYSGHYLCTAAAKGHKCVVRPQRMGIRQGYRIVVNRQLCVANAFEQVISERMPRFHRTVRYLYDKYGYPLSNHIKAPFMADLIYILMKPLEWGFLLILYVFDMDPETRIAKQYLPDGILHNQKN